MTAAETNSLAEATILYTQTIQAEMETMRAGRDAAEEQAKDLMSGTDSAKNTIVDSCLACLLVPAFHRWLPNPLFVEVVLLLL